jgi:hypothetical protein
MISRLALGAALLLAACANSDLFVVVLANNPASLVAHPAR